MSILRATGLGRQWGTFGLRAFLLFAWLGVSIGSFAETAAVKALSERESVATAASAASVLWAPVCTMLNPQMRSSSPMITASVLSEPTSIPAKYSIPVFLSEIPAIYITRSE